MTSPSPEKTLSLVQYAFSTATTTARLSDHVDRLLVEVLGQQPVGEQGLEEHRRVTSPSYGGPQELTARLVEKTSAELVWFQRGDLHCLALLEECTVDRSNWSGWLEEHAERGRRTVGAAQGFELAVFVDLSPWPRGQTAEALRQALDGVLLLRSELGVATTGSTSLCVARAPGRWWVVAAPADDAGSQAAAHYLLKLDRGTLPLALLARTALRHELARVTREVANLRAAISTSESWLDSAQRKALELVEHMEEVSLHASLALALKPAPYGWHEEIEAEAASAKDAIKSLATSLRRHGSSGRQIADRLFPLEERQRPIGQRTSRQGSQEVAMQRYDVGIITMKEEEYDALLDKLKPTATERGENRDYDVAIIETSSGPCRVAITRCVQQGNAHAQNAATEMLVDISPAFILVVGIAGGVPTPDFCLGDVLVSDYIQDLTIEDTGSAPTARRFNALGGPLHPSASRIVERLRAIERASSSWNSARSIGCGRPGLDGSHTTDDSSWNADINEVLKYHAKKTKPKATARKIASSDRLVKDPELIRNWRSVLKAVAAVEMESAGVYVVCQRQNVPFLAIRGISDIIGWKRDEVWTLYACHSAASYVRMLIGSGAFCLPANVCVAGDTLAVEGAGREGADSSSWFDAEFRLAREHVRKRRTEEANATLDRLIARADAEGQTIWSVRARMELVWRKADPRTKAEAERLLDVCESMAGKANPPEALSGSMLRARCRLQVMSGEEEATAALSALSEYSARALPEDDAEYAYQILRAGTDLAMLHAGFQRWEEVEAVLRRTEVAAVAASLAHDERSRVLRSVEEVRLRVAVEHGDLKTVAAVTESWVGVDLPDEAEDNATALQHYANMARHLKQYECGIACAAGASRAALTAGLDEYVLGADQTHATLLCMAGRVAEGLRLNEAVARRAEASKSHKVLVAAHLLAADHALQQEDGATAQRHAETALEAADDEMGELHSRQCLADACHLQGDFQLAHTHVAEALRLAVRLGMPSRERGHLLNRAVDLVGQEGAWDEAERYLEEWARVATDESVASEVSMARQRVEGYRKLHETFESLRNPESTNRPPPRSIHEGLSELVRPVLDWWDDLGSASADQLDYWGRGNFVRALRHLGRYPRAFTVVLEARTRADIERALRLCGLVADVVLVLWKGACREGSMLTVAPLHHDGSGGVGYILAAGSRLEREGVRGTWVPALTTGRLLPDDVIDLLAGAGRPWFESGRLLVVPAWSAGCINPGFGAMERLLTDTVRGIPVIQSASHPSLPWRMVPWFPEVPLQDLAGVASDPQFNRPRLRQLFMERSRLCAGQPIVSAVRELEQEIEAELLEFRDRVERQTSRYGWTSANEAWTNARIPVRAPVCEDESVPLASLSPWKPFLRIGELGYNWQIIGLSRAFESPHQHTDTEGEPFRGAGEWLAPDDEGPRFATARMRVE